MRVKKYVAPTMNDALTKIKHELGTDAVILNSKQIKTGGLFGLFKKTQIEVIAALDEHPISEVKAKQQAEVTVTKKEQPIFNTDVLSSDEQVLEEIKQLRRLVSSKTFQGNNSFSHPFDVLFHYLVEQGVHSSIAEEIVTKVEEDNSGKLNEQQLFEKADSFLTDRIDSFVADVSNTNKKILQFVGPTGVGKTTTIAKVAAKMMLEHKKQIAFITTDTYRIAAIEQLKTYAKILDVPLEVVYSNDDYEAALEKFSQYDHIFVDTAGRNYLETNYVHELKHMIQLAKGDSITFLVLSLTAKTSDNDVIYHIFKDVGIEHVILTKADETTTYGTILNLCLGEGANVAYIANGQDVPDDVVEGSPEYITNLILSRYRHA